MIMKNQLLNLKMIALMCLMMVLGGAKVWAQETKSVTCTLDKDASSSTFDPKESSFDLSYSRIADGKVDDGGVYWNCNNGEVTISAKLKDENSKITKIVANSKCGKVTPKLTVSVGNVQFGKTVSLTTSYKDYTFEGQASGEVKLHFTEKASSKPKSYFLKTITIYYTEASSSNKTATTLTFPQESCSFATTDDLTSFKGQTATLKAGEIELTDKTQQQSNPQVMSVLQRQALLYLSLSYLQVPFE